MTQNEISRLAVVESQIRELISAIEVLKESLIERITAQEKAINIGMLGQKEATSIAMVASEKAIVKAEIANDLRFGELDKRITEVMSYQNVATGTKAGATESRVDLTRYFGWIVSILTIVGLIITLFVSRGV